MQNQGIIISSKHKNQLMKEFKTSKQSVLMSLRYVFNSEQAKAIRNRAKELLLQEVEKIENQNQ
ncbi:MAG TPA: hypothetical protein DHV22_09950 [Xanthomarina gelatinilytica]|uniref:Uncharacterized protein n=1 Tax=Xanthomarina gelatinilytica TaxID=1137281 RepID=A0A3D6BV05_9FLAO|nr:hypothetical protein [Xanthomarina gelatinilytica]|tara:strand:+ start:68 stop:259 length:192 start_codon:yes stop_codon:yes gene_type:complete